MTIQTKSIGAKNPKYLCFIMHGWGSEYTNMLEVANEILEQSETIRNGVKFISINGIEAWENDPSNTNSRQWFKLGNRDPILLENGVKSASNIVLPFILETAKTHNIPVSNIFLSGFSQGAMMSLSMGYDLNETIAGIISFSGTLVRFDKPKTTQNLLIMHGNLDEVLSVSLSQVAHNKVKELGWNSEFKKIIGLNHSISNETIAYASNFIENIIKL